MSRSPVSSTSVASIGYDEPTETLEVEFTNGSVYQYFNVGNAIHEQLMQSPSVGQFLNLYIKYAYPFTRVG